MREEQTLPEMPDRLTPAELAFEWRYYQRDARDPSNAELLKFFTDGFNAGIAEGGKDAKPDMFWNDADPEHGRDSIHEILDDEWGDGILSIGDTRVIQQAVRLANITVRVIVDPDDEDSFDYEEVPPTPPAAMPNKDQK